MSEPARATTDQELAEAAQMGSAEAMGRLVERYLRIVYSIAYARLRQRESAEDLSQEVFLTAYLNLRTLKNPALFGAWITRIARNAAHDWADKGWRRSKLVAMVPLDEKAERLLAQRAQGRQEQMEAQERHEAVREAIFRLPLEQRELVLMRYVEGLSAEEIAQKTGIHIRSVWRQLNSAIDQMRASMESLIGEAAPAMRVSKSAGVRTLAILGAASALSAGTKSAMVAASAAVAKQSLASISPSLLASAHGKTLALLKTIPIAGNAVTQNATGGLIMTLQGKIIASCMAVLLFGAGAYHYQFQKQAKAADAGAPAVNPAPVVSAPVEQNKLSGATPMAADEIISVADANTPAVPTAQPTAAQPTQAAIPDVNAAARPMPPVKNAANAPMASGVPQANTAQSPEQGIANLRFLTTNRNLLNLMQMLKQSESAKGDAALQRQINELAARVSAMGPSFVPPPSAGRPIRPTSANFLLTAKESADILAGALKTVASCAGVKDNPDLSAKASQMISDTEKMAASLDARSKGPEAAQTPDPLYLQNEEIGIRQTMIEMAEIMKKCKGLENSAENIEYPANVLRKQNDVDRVQAEAQAMLAAGQRQEAVRAYQREQANTIDQKYGDLKPPMPNPRSPAEAEAVNRERSRLDSLVNSERARLMNEIGQKRQQGPALPSFGAPTPRPVSPAEQQALDRERAKLDSLINLQRARVQDEINQKRLQEQQTTATVPQAQATVAPQ